MLLFSCLVTLQLPVRADEYRDALAKLLSVNRTQQVTMLFSAGVQQHMQEAYGANVAAAFGNFMQSEEFADLIVDIFEPECRRKVSLEEVNELLEWCGTYSKVSSTQATHSFYNNLQSSNNSNYLYFLQDNITRMDKVVRNAKKGKPTKIVTYRMPKDFRAEVERLLGNIKAASVLDLSSALRETFMPLMQAQFPTIAVDDWQLPEVQAYMDRFINEAIAAMFYKRATLNDIKIVNTGMESPAYAHFQEAVRATSEMQMLVLFQELGVFIRWLKLHQPDVAQQFDNTIIHGKR